MGYNSKYKSSEIEDLLDKVAEGKVGVQPDWMESDPDSLAYIRNKTHSAVVSKIVTANGNFDATDYVYHVEGGLKEVPVGTSNLRVNTSGPPIVVSRPSTTLIVVSGDSSNYLKSFPLYLVFRVRQLSETFIPETIARKTDIVPSDWNEESEQAPSYIRNKPFGIAGFQSAISPLIISVSTIGTNLFEVYEDVCFQIGNTVYNTLHELGQDIILSAFGGPTVLGTVVKEGERYFVRHTLGSFLIGDVTYCNRVDVNVIPEAYIPENIARHSDMPINYDLNVKAINHRGYSYESPENTIPAYIMSKDKGFTYVEGDVAFTKDNVAVLLHDNTIDRTSNGSGKITDFNYQELLLYDFGSWFSSEYEGVRIPTFKEWILLCKNLGLHPYIELKSSGSYTQAQITQVVNEVASCGMKGKVTYISFNSTFLGYVKNADSSARLGFLTSTLSSGNITTAKNLKTTSNEVFLDARLSTLKDSVVDSCISNNIPLEVWTVNTEDEIIKMHSYISGVTSDYLVAGRTLYNNALEYIPPISSWVPTTGISLDRESLSISAFGTVTLVATVEPSNSSEEIVWKSSNTSIATVVNGVVTPIADGSCAITATSGDFSDSCSVDIAFIRYNVTRNLTGCSLSNTEDEILISKPYSGEIIPNEGYSLKNGTVKITMGGVDITSSAYSNGIINIESVTGDIVITVACVVVPVYSITRNLVGCASDKSTTTIGEGNPYHETFTAIENYRLSGATVNITMGDTDISSMYDDGVLSIPEVTGNIVISITAAVIPVYSISRNLINCSSDKTITSIKEGEPYTETISADDGYTLRGGNVTITMGGVDISSSMTSNGILTIEAVTGDISISAEAVEHNASIPVVYLDLANVGTDGVIKNLGTGGSMYDSTIQILSPSDSFTTSSSGLTLKNHAYANIPYQLKGSDKFTIICKAKIATKSSQTYQRFFRTDTDAPSWYYSKSNTKLQAKLAGKNSSESPISILSSFVSAITGTNNGGNSVIFSASTTNVLEVMFTNDGADIKLYINGVLSASQAASALADTQYIGLGDNNSDTKYYASALEVTRFAIYDSVITDEVVTDEPVNIRLTSDNLSQSAISSKNEPTGAYELIAPYRTNMTTRASTPADLSILVNGGKTVSVEAKDKTGAALQVGIQTFGDDALEALAKEQSVYQYLIDSGWISSGKTYKIPITHKYAWIVVSYPNTSTKVDVNNIDYIQISEVDS